MGGDTVEAAEHYVDRFHARQSGERGVSEDGKRGDKWYHWRGGQLMETLVEVRV